MLGSAWILAWKVRMRAGSTTEKEGGPWGDKSWWIRSAIPFFPWGSVEDTKKYCPRVMTVTIHSNSCNGAPVGLNSHKETIFGRVGNAWLSAEMVRPKRSFVMDGPPKL